MFEFWHWIVNSRLPRYISRNLELLSLPRLEFKLSLRNWIQLAFPHTSFECKLLLSHKSIVVRWLLQCWILSFKRLNSSTEFRTWGLVVLKLSYFIKVLQQSLQIHFKFFDTKKIECNWVWDCRICWRLQFELKFLTSSAFKLKFCTDCSF